jgi:hypothetical protein
LETDITSSVPSLLLHRASTNLPVSDRLEPCEDSIYSSIMMMIRQVVQSKELKWAIGGWTFFIAENALLSENRTYLIEQVLGDENYHLVYGTLSTAATASIGYAYYHLTQKNATLVHYFQNNRMPSKLPPSLPVANLLVSWTCLAVGLVLASQTLPKMQIPIRFTSSSSTAAATTTQNSSSPTSLIGPSPPPPPQQQRQQQPPPGSWKLSVQCPFDFSDKYKDNGGSNNSTMVTGVDRVSRHVGLWSLGLLSASQAALIIPSTAATVAASATTATSSPAMLFAALWSLRLWWCGPIAVAWLGGMHTDSRFRRGLGGTLDPIIDSQTSNLPFLAMMTGKQGSPYYAFANLVGSELKPLSAVMATAVATVWILSKGRRASMMSPWLSSSSTSSCGMMRPTTISGLSNSKLAEAASSSSRK